MDSTLVRSAIFGVRNADKTEKGQFGRAPVTVIQLGDATAKVSKLDCVIGKTAQTAIDALKSVSNGGKYLEYAGKALDFAKPLVNPLLVVSAGVDVVRADDKQKAVVESGLALGFMFAVESWMKKHLDSVGKNIMDAAKKVKSLEPAVNELAEITTKTKYGKWIPGIVHGGTFVVGSCLAYSAGQKFGDILMGEDKKTQKAHKSQPTPTLETVQAQEQTPVA